MFSLLLKLIFFVGSNFIDADFYLSSALKYQIIARTQTTGVCLMRYIVCICFGELENASYLEPPLSSFMFSNVIYFTLLDLLFHVLSQIYLDS